MIDKDPRAAKDFYREVRNFARRATGWQTNCIYYTTKPDEAYDPTLVSKRVYGRRDEYLAVMAVAGIDSVDCTLEAGRTLAFPNETELSRLKTLTGFESRADQREDYAPVWLEE